MSQFILGVLFAAGFTLVGVAWAAISDWRRDRVKRPIAIQLVDGGHQHCYLQFDAEQTDSERLHFLDLARQAVLDGRLAQAAQFQDQSAGNE